MIRFGLQFFLDQGNLFFENRIYTFKVNDLNLSEFERQRYYGF